MFLQKLLDHFRHKTYTSKVNEPIRMGWSFGKRAIFVGRVPQSGGEFMYQWDTVIEQIKKRGNTVSSCLLLGVAGGSAAKSLKKFYPNIRITGIELDPVILQVALNHNLFTLDQTIQVIIADGIKWIKTDRKKYDLIIVDVFLGAYNPIHSRQTAFLNDVKEHLTQKGIIVYNAHYDETNKKEYKVFVTRLKRVFKKLEVIFEFPKNKVLLLEK